MSLRIPSMTTPHRVSRSSVGGSVTSEDYHSSYETDNDDPTDDEQAKSLLTTSKKHTTDDTPTRVSVSRNTSLRKTTLSPGKALDHETFSTSGNGRCCCCCCCFRRLRLKSVGIVLLVLLSLVCAILTAFNNPALSTITTTSTNYHHDIDSEIHGPPVTLTGGETIESLLRDLELASSASHTSTGHFYSRRPKRGTEVMNNVANLPPSYPILRDTDDTALPPNADALNEAPFSSGVVHAAEALLCRQSVINFVINATDGKDECEGLKKAFDKTCSATEDAGESEEGLHNNNNNNNNQHHRGHRRQRTLWEKTHKAHHPHTKLYVWWHEQVRWLRQCFAQYVYGTSTIFFFAEDQVALAYPDAQCLIEQDLDDWIRPELRQQWTYEHLLKQERQRQLALDLWNDRVRALEEKYTNTSQVARPPPKSLSLPTASQHASENVLSATVLLHQGDQVYAKATNESMLANKDAKASSKAMADTNAAVSALLNDPTSVEARTCCASILNVYHENCSTDEDDQVSDTRLFFVVAVMALCGMVKSLIRHFRILWLPEAAGCILVGVMSGYVLMYFPHHDISFDGNWFLRILVPPIIFEAALSIDKRSFSRHVVPIAIYAVVGTLMSTALTAYFVHRGTVLLSGFCTPIPTVEALTFGALISSIDPIAVLSVLSNMGMTDTDTIYVVIFGESLLNDGIAIVLFNTLVHFLDENLVIDSEAMVAAGVHFFVVAFGSLLVGVASGMLSTIYYWLFHGCQTALVEVLMFVCWALLPYYVCDGIGWSGIVSAVATGFVMDLYIVGQQPKASDTASVDSDDGISPTAASTTIPNGGDRAPSLRENGRRSERRRRPIFSSLGHLSDEARQHIGFVTEIISTTMETAIFAYLGLFLFSHRYHWNIFHTIVAIMACCVSRAIMIPSLSCVANWVIRLQQHHAACRPQNKREAHLSPPGVVIDKRMQLVLWFAGLRGAMSFALVEHIPLYDSVSGEGTRLKPELKAMTSACIMFTVFILGGYTYYMMEFLGLAPRSSSYRKDPKSPHPGDGSNGDGPSFEMAPLVYKGGGDDYLDPQSGKAHSSHDEGGAPPPQTTNARRSRRNNKPTLRRNQKRITVLSTNDGMSSTEELQMF